MAVSWWWSPYMMRSKVGLLSAWWLHMGFQCASGVGLQLQVLQQQSAPLMAVAASFFSLATIFKNYSLSTNASKVNYLLYSDS